MHLQPLTVFNYSVKNQADNTVDLFVDGDIVDSATKEIMQKYFGDETSVSFKSLRDQIPAGVKTINLYVNSGGGHVGDAMAMHDYLKDLESKGVTVNRYGRGIVASAATYLVMGNNSNLSENSWFMIHNVSGFAYGDVNQVENQAKTMRKFNDRINNFYAEMTGLSRTVIGNMMDSETWLTAQEAKDKGFVAAVTGKVEFTNQIKEDAWPFKNMAVLNSYNSFTKNSPDMKKEILDAITNGFNTLMEKAGLKNKQEDETVKAAVVEFTASIENAIKEGGVSDETLKTTVTNAVAEAMKNLADSDVFKTATQNFVTSEAIANMATKDDIKDVVTNKTLGDKLTETKDEIVNAVADKMGNGGNKNQKKVEEEEVRRVPKNKYAGVNLWNGN
jgi:ATP-dependent Clp protease protease subunit